MEVITHEGDVSEDKVFFSFRKSKERSTFISKE